MKHFVESGEHILLAAGGTEAGMSPIDHFVESAEHVLGDLISLLTFCLEAIAAALVLFGLIRTVQLVFRLQRRKRRFHVLQQPVDFTQVRMVFGMWLALALEFQLGADILQTTISPSFESLGRLAAIAVIRTFLNYFLQKEIEAATRDLQHSPKEDVETSIRPAPEGSQEVPS